MAYPQAGSEAALAPSGVSVLRPLGLVVVRSVQRDGAALAPAAAGRFEVSEPLHPTSWPLPRPGTHRIECRTDVLDTALVYHQYTTMKAATSLSQEAHSRLRDLILDGSLRPDELLSERRLAIRLNVSRMPVREALRQLKSDGLLEIVPFRGAFVRQLSFTEVRDIYEARQAIEGMAAYLAAERGGTTKLQSFRARLTAAREQGVSEDLRKIQRDGVAFHTAIVDASCNARLSTLAHSLQSQIALTLHMALRYSPKRILDTITEHLQILDAIESGDGSEARDQMVAHLAAGLEVSLSHPS